MELTAAFPTRASADAERVGASCDKSLQVRGLDIGRDELLLIREVLAGASGRTAASQELCRLLDYKQPNGWLKERAMRDVLRRLAALGYVQLPPPLTSAGGAPRKRVRKNVEIDQSPIKTLESQIEVRRVTNQAENSLWDQLIEEHHYLGRKPVVGRNLKQLVYCGDRPVACLAWADPCLRLGPRENFLQESGVEGTNLDCGVNNTRFLLLPWVEIPNLASRILALATKHVRHHWDWYYHADLLWAETFVDPSRFAGTCYLAANWRIVGITRGTARSGLNARRIEHGQQKQILIYRFGRRRKRVG